MSKLGSLIETLVGPALRIDCEGLNKNVLRCSEFELFSPKVEEPTSLESCSWI